MTLVKDAWLNAETVDDVYSTVEEVSGAIRFGLQISVTGSPSGAGVKLQGSIDGSNWLDLTTATLSTPFVGYGVAASHVVVKYIRLYLDQLSGGSSPTLTASVIAV